MLLLLSHQQQNRHNTTHLMPQIRFANQLHVEHIVRRIPKTLAGQVHIGALDLPDELDDAVLHVHFAQIPEVIDADQMLAGGAHRLDVHAAAREEVAVGALFAVESETD